MLTTPHAVTGAAIGALLLNPLLCIPIAFASHFVLDGVLHWQETLAPYTPTKKTYIRMTFDIALSFVLVALIARWNPSNAGVIWLGALAANLPDFDSIVIVLPALKTGIVKKFWDWHCKIQRETSSYWGILPQIFVITAALLLAKNA